MTVKCEIRTIDGISYEFYTLGARKSVKILVRLTKLAGGPVGDVIRSLKFEDGESVLDAKIDSGMLGQAFATLAERLHEDEVLNTIEELLEPVLADGKKIQFETMFAGRIGHLMKVVGACLQINYSDFFGGSGGLSAFAQAAVKKVMTQANLT